MLDTMTLVLADSEIPKIAIIGGLVVAMVSIVSSMVHRIVRSLSDGKTRREIAAYVAEGSMTAEEGERLINAAQKRGSCG